jgi:uncharacterized protein (DUF849 family)
MVIVPAAGIGPETSEKPNVRLEDLLWLGLGRLTESNVAQSEVRQVIEGLGLEIATPDDVREVLAVKGAENAAF